MGPGAHKVLECGCDGGFVDWLDAVDRADWVELALDIEFVELLHGLVQAELVSLGDAAGLLLHGDLVGK